MEITPQTTVVNVNRGRIDGNTKGLKLDAHHRVEPPISVRRGKRGQADYGSEVAILDAGGQEVARFIYDPANKLVSCGARIVLVAHHGAKVIA